MKSATVWQIRELRLQQSDHLNVFDCSLTDPGRQIYTVHHHHTCREDTQETVHTCRRHIHTCREDRRQ